MDTRVDITAILRSLNKDRGMTWITNEVLESMCKELDMHRSKELYVGTPAGLRAGDLTHKHQWPIPMAPAGTVKANPLLRLPSGRTINLQQIREVSPTYDASSYDVFFSGIDDETYLMVDGKDLSRDSLIAAWAAAL